jgi:Putative phage metallopeptidase
MSKKIYTRFNTHEEAIINDVMTRYHTALVEAGVTVVGVVGTKFDAEDQPVRSLKHAGVFAAAMIHAIPVRKKLFLGHDAEIEVDGAVWDGLSTAMRHALIDHELCHLVPVTDKAGQLKRDDNDRPVLKCRPDDFMINGFLAVIERHGNASLELASVNGVHTACQLSLGRHLNAPVVGTATTNATTNPLNLTTGIVPASLSQGDPEQPVDAGHEVDQQVPRMA